MAAIALRSPPPKDLVSLALSLDMQAEKRQSQVQLQPCVWLLDGEEDNRELLMALWYIKARRRKAREHCETCASAFSNRGTKVAMSKAGTQTRSVNGLSTDESSAAGGIGGTCLARVMGGRISFVQLVIAELRNVIFPRIFLLGFYY